MIALAVCPSRGRLALTHFPGVKVTPSICDSASNPILTRGKFATIP